MSCITIKYMHNSETYSVALQSECVLYIRHCTIEFMFKTCCRISNTNRNHWWEIEYCNVWHFFNVQPVYLPPNNLCFIRWKEPLRLYDSFAFHPFPVEDFLGERVVCIWIVTSAIWRRSVRDRIWRLWLEKVYNGWELPQLSVQK